MTKKDYKSFKWTPNFSCVTPNDHNMVNFYHIEPINFPQWSSGCELYAFLYVQSEKMDGRYPKDTKDYRSFHVFLPTSIINNSLNFQIFWMVQVSKCHSRGIFHAIFLVKRKFQVECHFWMQNIIGHIWRKTWNISKYGKSTLFFPNLTHCKF